MHFSVIAPQTLLVSHSDRGRRGSGFYCPPPQPSESILYNKPELLFPFTKTFPLRKENTMTRKYPLEPSTQLKLFSVVGQSSLCSPLKKTSIILKCVPCSGTINKAFSQKNNIYIITRNRKHSKRKMLGGMSKLVSFLF